jgi:hypothetical protein
MPFILAGVEMDNHDLLYNLLELSHPWRVLDIRDDLRDRQIDVWIGIEQPRKSWIFGRTPPAQQTTEHVWRHANLGAMRCVIHASLPLDTDTTDLRWCGETNAPFTRSMSLHVAALMSQGVPLQHICTLLDVSVEDLWKFRHRLNSGAASLSGPGQAAGSGKAGGDPGNLPEPDDPIWEALLEGSASIDIRILSLKLLLAKMRDQMQAIKDQEVRTLKAYELQRYFARNEKQLAYELAQLRKNRALH